MNKTKKSLLLLGAMHLGVSSMAYAAAPAEEPAAYTAENNGWTPSLPGRVAVGGAAGAHTMNLVATAAAKVAIRVKSGEAVILGSADDTSANNVGADGANDGVETHDILVDIKEGATLKMQNHTGNNHKNNIKGGATVAGTWDMSKIDGGAGVQVNEFSGAPVAADGKRATVTVTGELKMNNANNTVKDTSSLIIDDKGVVEANKTIAGAQANNFVGKVILSGEGSLNAINSHDGAAAAAAAATLTNTFDDLEMNGGQLNAHVGKDSNGKFVANAFVNNTFTKAKISDGTLNASGASNTIGAAGAGNTVTVSGNATVNLDDSKALNINNTLTISENANVSMRDVVTNPAFAAAGKIKLDGGSLIADYTKDTAADLSLDASKLELNGGTFSIQRHEKTDRTTTFTAVAPLSIKGTSVDLTNHADEGTYTVQFDHDVTVEKGSLDISNKNSKSKMIVNVGTPVAGGGAVGADKDLTVGENGRLTLGGKNSTTNVKNLVVDGEIQFHHEQGDFGQIIPQEKIQLNKGAKISASNDVHFFAKDNVITLSDQPTTQVFMEFDKETAAKITVDDSVQVINNNNFAHEYTNVSFANGKLTVTAKAAQIADQSGGLVEDLSNMIGNVIEVQNISSQTQFGFAQNNATKAKNKIQKAMRNIMQQRLRNDAKLNAVMQTLAENKEALAVSVQNGNKAVFFTPYFQAVNKSNSGSEDGYLQNAYGVLVGYMHGIKESALTLKASLGAGFTKRDHKTTQENNASGKHIVASLGAVYNYVQNGELKAELTGLYNTQDQKRLSKPDAVNSTLAKSKVRNYGARFTGEVNYAISLSSCYDLIPNLGGHVTWSKRNAFKETGLSDEFAQSFSAQSGTKGEVFGGLGLRRHWNSSALSGSITGAYALGYQPGRKNADTKFTSIKDSRITAIKENKITRLTHYLKLFGTVTSQTGNWHAQPSVTAAFQGKKNKHQRFYGSWIQILRSVLLMNKCGSLRGPFFIA